MESRSFDIKVISEKKGRGLIATRHIKKDTVIDIAHVLILSDEEYRHLSNTLLDNYVFEWKEKEEDPPLLTAVAMSYVEFMNHSYSPNCEYVKNYKEKWMKFFAIKDIEPGEELTVNYNRDPKDKSPVWFDVIEQTKPK